jgi:hypothetical protein
MAPRTTFSQNAKQSQTEPNNGRPSKMTAPKEAPVQTPSQKPTWGGPKGPPGSQQHLLLVASLFRIPADIADSIRIGFRAFVTGFDNSIGA